MDSLYNSKIYLFLFGFFFGSLIVLLTVMSCSGGPKNEIEYGNAGSINTDNQEKDAQFLVDADEIHMMEIQLGQLAQKKSSSADIKELGRSMEEQYHDSHTRLIALAKQKLVTLPTITTKKAQAAYDKLNEKSDMQFDKAYCNLMVSEHKEAVAKFEKASENSKDHDIKVWALATLPLIKVHLDRAIQCQKKNESL
ncbi:MAG TPA: DUF4142 domain-containing protein [Saprospiraceae bacterium]|nr:DUF4142 domain-containing protein [Saprospiraceae bacterium]